MKRFAVVLLALMMALTAFAACAEEIATIEEEETQFVTMYTVGDHDINVYAEADVESDIVGRVLSRMPVTVIEPDKDAEFQYVMWTSLGEQYEGYMKTEKLCRFETAELCVYAFVVGEKGLYLRTEPNVKAKAIGLMPCGTRVIVSRYHSQWASVTVEMNGRTYEGYCYHGPSNICLRELGC